jgi:hypothetical protein
MNIFILDKDPKKAASYHCDKHVVKMILESAQIVSTVFRFYNQDLIYLYKATHVNHPCVVWARQSAENFKWLIDLGYCLCKEYTKRYKKVHACDKMFHQFYKDMIRLHDEFPEKGLTPFAQAMPEKYKSDDAVESYRNYYRFEKESLLKYKNTNKPNWL